MISVALRKESVDRNKCSLGNPYKKPWSLSARRAWIEIGNKKAPARVSKSLSARRAWIEIPLIVGFPGVLGVALRKESVDRNPLTSIIICQGTMSLSARRAWIEILSSHV